MKSDKLLISLLVGISVGALLGIIVARKKGLDTSKKINKKKDDFNEALSGLIDSITERFNHLKEEIEEYVEQEKDKI